ncbi:MAG: lipoate--protein ligase family protein [Bacteroidales bacterium]|nr:lipoate--protein ligase family protein [Bacteroidales bacterium]
MRYLVNDSTDPYFNMSFDEWCLERLQSDDVVFYLWRNRSSVIIGVNQNQNAEVNLPYLRAHGIDLVRRSTGGGAVYHDLQNLNYSFVGPATVTDGSIVLGVADALRGLGVKAEVGGRNDIFVDGRKVSGYARRLWRDRAIIHGTLMYDVDIDTLTKALDTPGSKLHRKGVASVRSRVANLRELLPGFRSMDELQSYLQEFFSGGDDRIELSQKQIAEVSDIRDSKYADPKWIYGTWDL